MTDRNRNALGRTSSHVSDVGSASSIRPRTRRFVDADDGADKKDSETQNRGLRSPLLFAFGQDAGSRSASPFSLSRRATGNSGPTRVASTGNLGQFFSDSWNQSWNSVQDLTSTLFAQDGPERRPRNEQNGARKTNTTKSSNTAKSWGPAPPTHGPKLDDVAAGSLAERQSALKAARTASVLQSHDGVNGGLDVSGKHKRRDSNEVAPASQAQAHEEYLVYVHHVQPNDTYAGLILRYKCHEDAFRRANGLWSRDSVQTKKWLTIPVDACEIRGRPCEAPSGDSTSAVPLDLLAPTPRGDEDDTHLPRETGDSYFSNPAATTQSLPSDVADDKPWTHVRWVKIDSIPHPVEIGRVSRGAMGYFPPRRKRSIRTVSSFSTPRQSLDMSTSNTPGSAGASSSRRLSSLGSRPPIAGVFATRSRLGSDASNVRPVWMREPGGVGTMSRTVKAPGPDKDPLNTWTRKHIPGLNIDGPSMAIMGSETAHFGFSKDRGGDTTGIVESPFQGKDVSAANIANMNGTPLDRAAAAVETWLRGALAKRPSTPMGNRSNLKGSPFGGDSGGDLIELADTSSDDGRFNMETNVVHANNSALATSSRNDDSGLLRGRTMGSGLKGAKAD